VHLDKISESIAPRAVTALLAPFAGVPRGLVPSIKV